MQQPLAMSVLPKSKYILTLYFYFILAFNKLCYTCNIQQTACFEIHPVIQRKQQYKIYSFVIAFNTMYDTI